MIEDISLSPSILDKTEPVASWVKLLRAQTSPIDNTPSDHQALEVFIKGGLQALDAQENRSKWVQLDVALPSSDVLPALFTSLSKLSNTLLAEGQIENMFYMRKSPGLRIRFEASISPNTLRQYLDSAANEWTQGSLISHHGFGIYEPETQLFGGRESMVFVHSLFTLDSLIWLQSLSQEQAQADTWQASFNYLKAVFEGLGISGWEDLGVWAYIVEQTGRTFPTDIFETSKNETALTTPILSWWQETAKQGNQDFKQMHDTIVKSAERWKEGYFQTPDAWIGVRQAAAYLTIFHWNRAGLSPAQQGLIANTLAYRRVQTATESAA